MASKPLSIVRRVRSHAIDAPVAALAGLAVAFVAFAMPVDLFTDLVGGSGLPSLLPAAEPPLGFKARLTTGAAAALAVFAAVLLLLRLADRAAAPLSALRRNREEEESDLPRPRRRDFHPDAPAPRPILAARDLGEPGGEALPPPAADERIPIWLADAEGSGAAIDFDAPETGDEAPVEEPPCDELVLETIHSEPEPQAAPERQPMPAAEQPRQAPPAGGESIAELLARLERGLAKRRRAPPAAEPDNGAAAMPQVFPDAGDVRLRNAIESLQRLAARHG